MLRTIIYGLFLFLHPVLANADQEKSIKVEGAELFCQTMGSGEPIIVLHGGAGFLTHDYLLPHFEPLAKDHLLVFYDQRGQGQSSGDITSAQINLKTYVEDLEAIRTSLGFKKVTLLGHSFGSFLAVHYAFSHPESVDKLILMSSMPGNSNDLGLFFTELAVRLEPYSEKLQEIEDSKAYLSGDPQTVENQLKMVFQTYMSNPENIKKINLHKSQSAILKGFKVWDIFREKVFMKPYDLTKQLSTIECQTLILHGDSDAIPYVSAEHLKEAIPFSHLVKIDQCGHFPFVEEPKACFSAIEDFLKS